VEEKFSVINTVYINVTITVWGNLMLITLLYNIRKFIIK